MTDRLRRLAHLAPTARSARSPSASAPARSSTCSPPRPCRRPGRRRWPSPSTARCPTASPPRTWSSTLIAHTGTGGGQGYVVEYRGQAIEALSMEGRMTVCNMSIEWGAKAGLIAPDQTTFDYLEGRPRRRQGADWDAAVAHWQTLVTDDDAVFDEEIVLDAAHDDAVRHLGHQPRARACRSARAVPDPERLRRARATGSPPRRPWSTWASRPARRCATSRSTPSSSARAPTAGSRTCAPPPRSSRAARSPTDTRLLVVPGSVRVRLQAEDEGLDVVFKEAGAEWRGAGLLDVPGHEPRPARARGAQRVDLQPQLRGPAGQGRPHPPGVAAGRRRHRRRAARSSSPADLADPSS